MNGYELEAFLEILPATPRRERTYLEEMRAAQRETIMANLLAFYFKPQKPHGLGNLFLRSLMETECKELFENKRSQNSAVISNPEILKVKVEDSTKEKKRIDILIETTEAVIAIEFKINHALNNALDLYINHIETNKEYEGKQFYYFVLTPAWKKPVFGKCDKKAEFRQVMLAHFVAKVENNIAAEFPEFLASGNTHAHHCHDFVTTIKNRRGRLNMIENYAAAVDENEGLKERLDEVLSNLTEIQAHIEAEILKLKEVLKGHAQLPEFLLLNGKKTKLDRAIGATTKTGTLKVRLSLKGWTIEEWENGKKTGNLAELGFTEKLPVVAEAVVANLMPKPEEDLTAYTNNPVPRIYPELSEEQKRQVLREFKRIQDEEERER